MKGHHNLIFYVCFCFIILFTNSCKAQEERNISKDISAYFGQLKKDGLQVCIDNESEFFEAIKQRGNKEMYDALMGSCNERVSHYGLYEADTKSLLTTLYKNDDSDFIIVNTIDPHNDNTLVSATTLTFSRKKNEKEIQIINNRYEYNEEKKRDELIKSSSISNFNVAEKMKLIEDYLYNNKKNSISEISRGQPYTEYYVVARINGKYLIKTLRDYNLKD